MPQYLPYPPAKKSLGIFGGLRNLIAQNEAQEAAKEEKQIRLEDRLAASTRRGLEDIREGEKHSLEQRLGEKTLAKPDIRDVDNNLVDVTKPDAPRVVFRSTPKLTQSEPLERVLENGRPVYRPRSQAVGKEAPRPEGDNTVVKIQNDDGSVTYVPRSQAVGQQAPVAGAGGATRAQRVQALANVSDALDQFEGTIGATGSVIKPGVDKSTLQTSYENVQLQMKELFNLGVLNGPDLLLMRRVLNDPTSIKDRALAGGSAQEQTKRTSAQVAQVRQILQRYQENLAEGNDALPRPARSGRAGGPGGAVPPKPPTDPEFDALMASLRPRKP